MPNHEDVIAITFCAFLLFFFLLLPYPDIVSTFGSTISNLTQLPNNMCWSLIERHFFAFTGRIFYGFENLNDKTIVQHNISLETNK
jgi:hypothetical protein